MGGPRRFRATFVAGVLIVALALASLPAAARVQAQKVRSGRACTMVPAKKVARAFGKPVAIAQDGFLKHFGCDVAVGADPAQPPGGELRANQVFPFFGESSAQSAVEDNHAIDFLAHNQLEDLDGLGKYAYLNHSIGRIVVQVSKKFAFSLQWTRAGATGLSDADLTKLIGIAKDIVTRSPR